MEPYRNTNGDSGVVGYHIHRDSITIEFSSGETYIYDHYHPGRSQLEEMKRLARRGQGLSTYISQVVRKNYSRKIHADRAAF